jgi:phosphonopyruvate decarboxylase
MNNLLTDCGIPYEVLPDFEEGAADALDLAIYHMQKRQSPYAFLVRRACFFKYHLQNPVIPPHELTREQAIEKICSLMGRFDVTVATTGFAARELYEFRKNEGQDGSRDFLCVGSMGHASSIAMGVSLGKPSKNVYCMDGDGAMLMHMGALP